MTCRTSGRADHASQLTAYVTENGMATPVSASDPHRLPCPLHPHAGSGAAPLTADVGWALTSLHRVPLEKNPAR
jgi:hypothetical protein